MELFLLCALLIFGLYALIMRFKTFLLFFIFSSIAFGLLTAMMQAIMEAKNLELQEQKQLKGDDPISSDYLLLHGIGNILVSITSFIAAVCFYFYRDSLIMFDFSKNSMPLLKDR